MLSRGRRMSLEPSNRHLPMTFVFIRPRVPIFDLDSYELASAIRRSMSSGSADIAIQLVEDTNLSGPGFMELSDLKLEELSNGNPTVVEELKNFRGLLASSTPAFMSTYAHRLSIWATFRGLTPDSVDIRARGHQVISPDLIDINLTTDPFDFDFDSCDLSSGGYIRSNDTSAEISAAISSIPILSSSSAAILGTNANDSSQTLSEISSLQRLRQFPKMGNQAHMETYDILPENTVTQRSSPSSSLRAPTALNQEEAPDVCASPEIPAGIKSENSYVLAHGDHQAVNLQERAIGDVEGGGGEIIGHAVFTTQPNINDANNFSDSDEIHGLNDGWNLPIPEADVVGPSSVSEIHGQRDDEECRSQPIPGDSSGHFDAVQDDQAELSGSIKVGDSTATNELTTISPNMPPNIVNLQPGANEEGVYDDLVLVFMERPYTSDGEVVLYPDSHRYTRPSPYGDLRHL